jgi:GNAT superfamily N-acetyltransferase
MSILIAERDKERLMIRPAVRSDVAALHALIGELAKYEKLEREHVGSADDLGEHLFGARTYCEALVAETDGNVIGFALFFHNYSTFLARPGMYLEDLFVLPDHRRHGHGRDLLRAVARIAVQRRCGRFEWSVLDWNEPAIRFYRSLGAQSMDEWRIFRLTGDALAKLAG